MRRHEPLFHGEFCPTCFKQCMHRREEGTGYLRTHLLCLIGLFYSGASVHLNTKPHNYPFKLIIFVLVQESKSQPKASYYVSKLVIGNTTFLKI